MSRKPFLCVILALTGLAGSYLLLELWVLQLSKYQKKSGRWADELAECNFLRKFDDNSAVFVNPIANSIYAVYNSSYSAVDNATAYFNGSIVILGFQGRLEHMILSKILSTESSSNATVRLALAGGSISIGRAVPPGTAFFDVFSRWFSTALSTAKIDFKFYNVALAASYRYICNRQHS